MTDKPTESLWIATTGKTHHRELREEVSADVAIVGGGITGLTAALRLKRAGKSVLILEMNRIAGAESGHTTAHLTEQIDVGYRTLARDYGKEGARLAAEGSREAIETIARNISELGIDCAFERVPGYWYTEREADLKHIEEEIDSCREVGIAVEMTRKIPLPFPTIGGMVVENQAQFHPRAYFLALAKAFEGDGCAIFENSRVIDVEEGEPCRVKTEHGSVLARDVIVAANVPVNNRVLIHTKVAAYRSYALAVRAKEDIRGLFWDTDDPYHYTRPHSIPGKGVYLIVGGEDHKTGTEEDTEVPYSRLEEYVRQRFTVDSIDYRWSGQIIEPVDGLPYIGLNSGSKHVYIATGYAGQGMTFGTLAGVILSDLVTTGESRYAALFDATRAKPAGLKDYIKENLDFPRFLLSHRLTSSDVEAKDLESVGRGEGKIVQLSGKKIAIYRGEADEIVALSPVCTHLFCDVQWNTAERTWDCPCHGSRFTPNGDVVNGPATGELRPFDLKELLSRPG